MKTFRTLLLILFVLSFLLPTPATFAQGEDAKAEAIKLASEGLKLYQAARYQEALAKFQSALLLYNCKRPCR